MNGRQLAEVLRQDFHLEIEMEAENYVIALTSVGDTEEGFDRLCRAVEEIDSRDSLKYSEEAVKKERCRCAELNSLMRISCAMDALSERCTLEESIGEYLWSLRTFILRESLLLYPGSRLPDS